MTTWSPYDLPHRADAQSGARRARPLAHAAQRRASTATRCRSRWPPCSNPTGTPSRPPSTSTVPTFDDAGNLYFAPFLPHENVTMISLDPATGARRWAIPGTGAPVGRGGADGAERSRPSRRGDRLPDALRRALAVRTDGTHRVGRADRPHAHRRAPPGRRAGRQLPAAASTRSSASPATATSTWSRARPARSS